VVNLDVLFRAATGDGDHYPHAGQDYDANHDPGSLDVLQNAQLPECGENATDEQGKSQKIHSCPFHGAPPDRRLAPSLLDAPGPGTVPCWQHDVNASHPSHRPAGSAWRGGPSPT